ncbi:hypothetical protein PI95_016370 [Hassallia byssoidea VB512170]|uniref:Uncharacterized protein n=1 Tax=Hassallia byssoidea VB512170 TaxID=1304833 RepID=A0A846HBG4_9CYAN|nr:hypothetical protein [Hassalia byssoidea]NEU74089.1 hypothetical protein [Hassalia byssoidea VB512170]
MFRWLFDVCIPGYNNDLYSLLSNLNGDEIIILKNQQHHPSEKYYFSSKHLNDLEKSNEVSNRGEKLLLLLNGACYFSKMTRHPLQIRDLYERTITGDFNKLKSYNSTIDIPTFSNNMLQTSLKKNVTNSNVDDINKCILIAQDNKYFYQILFLMGKGSPLQDWVNLYRIYEIIETGLEFNFKQIASKNKLQLFKHTANHPQVSGDAARHGILPNNQPPTNPMNIEEAENLMRLAIQKWILLTYNIDINISSNYENFYSSFNQI